mgnify:CR=1 FL=1
MWADEVGISMKPVIGNTWATRGNTPTIFAKTNWEKLSVIGGITSQGQFFQQTHEGSIKAPGFISFLTHLLRHIEGKLTVVVDNAKIHRAKIVMEFVAKHERLTITHLPPYSPELNPIELVWAYVKRHCLANFCPENLGQLKAYLRTIWPKIRYRQLPSKLLGIQHEVLETWHVINRLQTCPPASAQAAQSRQSVFRHFSQG